MANEQAIHYSMHKNFLPILLTSLTTAVGFASLGISAVIPIKTLGIATATRITSYNVCYTKLLRSAIMMGMEYGLDTFKLFPANIVGGVGALKAFAGPRNNFV